MATGHGHTPAAWTGVGIMFVGVIVGAIAVVMAMIWLMFVGLGIVVLGAAVGGVMAMMGLGQPRGDRAGGREDGGRENQVAAH